MSHYPYDEYYDDDDEWGEYCSECGGWNECHCYVSDEYQECPCCHENYFDCDCTPEQAKTCDEVEISTHTSTDYFDDIPW
jgi:hypothetical protein